MPDRALLRFATRFGTCPSPRCVYKLFSSWLIVSCLLSSTASYLVFRGQLDPWLLRVTGNEFEVMNYNLSIVGWTCMCLGMCGPILQTFVCLMPRRKLAIAVSSFIVLILVTPGPLFFSFLHQQASLLFNSTETLPAISNHAYIARDTKMSIAMREIIHEKMLLTLENYTNHDALSKAWNDTQFKLECCGVDGSGDWRRHNRRQFRACQDFLPQQCYEAYYDSSQKRVEYKCKVVHTKGCFPEVIGIIEETFRSIVKHSFIAVIVMSFWGVLAVTCPWVWQCIHIDVYDRRYHAQVPEKTKPLAPAITRTVVHKMETLQVPRNNVVHFKDQRKTGR